MLKNYNKIFDNDWFIIKEIRKNIWVIDDNNFDTIYLIIGKERALLIDTGIGIANLHEEIRKITSLPILVVNTHGHADHTFGDGEFNEIYIGRNDLPFIEYFDDGGTEHLKYLLDELMENFFSKRFNLKDWEISKPKKLIPIDDGYDFDLGDKKIKVVSCSGHTPGSVCLLDEKEKLLFTGDSILRGNIWLHIPYSTNLQTYYESLLNIYKYKDSFDGILSGHADLNRLPDDKNIFFELKNGTEKILNETEKIKRKKHLYKFEFENCGIFYKEKGKIFLDKI